MTELTRSSCAWLALLCAGLPATAAAQGSTTDTGASAPASSSTSSPAPDSGGASGSTSTDGAASSSASTAPEAAASPSLCPCPHPPPRFTVYLGGLTGGGSTVAGPNPYGYAIGWEAGVTLGKPAFYFGIAFPWYAGDLRAFQITADLGYDFRSGPAVLRPLVALGGDRWRVPDPLGGPDLKEGALLFDFGMHLHFDLGRLGFLGGEFRWSYTTHGGDDNSWHAWGVFGVRIPG